MLKPIINHYGMKRNYIPPTVTVIQLSGHEIIATSNPNEDLTQGSLFNGEDD